MSKKDKQTKVTVYEIDMNIDTAGITKELLYYPLTEDDRDEYQKEIDEWAAKPPESRGARPKLVRESMSGAEFFKDIIMKAVSMVHKTGNTASLRRTKSISDLIELALDKKKGILEVMEEDFKYIKSTMAKADGWNNTDDIARSIIMVEDVIQDAENQAKKESSSDDKPE